MDVEVILNRRGDREKDQFHKIYEMESNLSGNIDQKVFLGDRNNRKCRFCGESGEQTTFRKKAHVLPEFMGNKRVFSYFECDKCNSLFSPFEDALSRYCGIVNTISLLKGKRGVPKHKSNNKDLEILEDQGILRIRISEKLENCDEIERDELLGKYKSLKIDKEKGTITIESQKQSYIPKDALKAFVKIGLSLIEESELIHFERTRKWLLNQFDDSNFKDYPYFSVFENHKTKRLMAPVAVIFRKRKMFKNLPCPERVLIVMYGLFTFQVLLPFNDFDEWMLEMEEIKVPLEAHLSEIKNETEETAKVKLKVVDLSSEELKVGEKDFFTAGIQERK